MGRSLPLLVWLSLMRKAPPGFPGNKSSSSAVSLLRPSYSHLVEHGDRQGELVGLNRILLGKGLNMPLHDLDKIFPRLPSGLPCPLDHEEQASEAQRPL